MPELRVMKFGGTSVGNAKRIQATAALLIESARERPTVGVVSAMSGVTDLLVAAARFAAAGKSEDVERTLAAIRKRHGDAAAELLEGEARDAYEAAVVQIVGDVENTCEGIARLSHCPKRAMDAVSGCGEKLSALLVAGVIERAGMKAQALDATRLIVTDTNFGEAAPNMDGTRQETRAAVLPLLAQGTTPVITGFIGATPDGAPTTLGRGGSDYSATIIAACLEATDVVIWTDVEGIFSADPNLVPSARVLPAVTYQEAAELAYYGARVLHAKTLAPLADRGIPVWTKSSFHPERPGTLIAQRGTFAANVGVNGGAGARAVTALKQVVLITIESSGHLSATTIMARSFSVLSHDRVDLLMLSQASREESFCFAVHQRDAGAVMRRLEEAFALELAHGYVKPFNVQAGIGVVALVGSGMRGTVGIAGKLFGALSGARVNIIAIAQGATETNISVAVDEASLGAAVRAVHGALLEHEEQHEAAAASAGLPCS